MNENEIIIYIDKIRNYNLTQLKIELYKLELIEYETTSESVMNRIRSKRKIVEKIMEILQEDLEEVKQCQD